MRIVSEVVRGRGRAGRVVLLATMVAWAAADVLRPSAAHAHHAWNEIDTARTLTLTGVVKSVKWENPHASLVLETVEGGARVDWTVMMSGLARMQQRGVDQAMVAVGKPLVVVASPARDEPHVVRANRIHGDDGDHVLY